MSKFSKLHHLWIVAVLALLTTILSPSFVAGQNTSSQPPSKAAQSAADLTLDKLRLKRSEVEALQDLDKASKDSAIKLLDQAIGYRELLDEFNGRSKALSRQIKTAPQRIKTVQSELAKPFLPPEAVEAMAAEKLQQETAKVREEAEEAKDKTPELAAAVKTQYDINIELSTELEEVTRQVTAVTENVESVTNHLQEMEDDFVLATARVETLVLTEAIGLALRRQRQLLPSTE